MTALIQDLRYGIRMLAKNPGFTLVAVVTLALGIGANTAIFSVVNAVLLRPLPFHDPEQLVGLWETEAAPGHYPLTGADYLDWQAQTKTMQATSLFDWGSSFNASGQGEPERAYVVRTQSNFFSLLGVQPVAGRAFLKGEDQAGRDHVAVLSYDFWQQNFGGEATAIGKDLQLNDESYTVVGVMPAWFRSVGEADIWIPLDMSPKKLSPRGQHQYRAIGRLKPGVPLAECRTELQGIAQRLEKQYPDSNEKVGAVVIPLRKQLVGDSRPALLVLLAAVGLVLLIACANVASLMLVRSSARHREMAVRQSLGAGRWRLARQMLTESVLLSLLGAAVGLLVGWWGVQFLVSATVPIPRANPVTLDGAVLAFTLAVGVLVGILVGLAPAFQISQLHLSEELKATVQSVLGASGRGRLLRDVLVVGEVAISLALLVGAGLLLRSFVKLRQSDIGIRPEGLLTAQLALPQKRYTTAEQSEAFFSRLLDGLNSAPGVEVAAVGSHLPLEGGSNGYVTVEGQPSPVYANVLVEQNGVSAGYFRAFGIPFLAGRNFNRQDSAQAAQALQKYLAMAESGKMHPLSDITLVAVINQKMARQFWRNQDPLGKVFKLGGLFPVSVIGVVGDVNEWGIRQPVIPQAYYPLAMDLAPPVGSLSVVVRGAPGEGGLLSVLRSQIRSLDSSLALFKVRTMHQVISESMAGTTSESFLLLSFALLALLLTAVGMYGVVAYASAQRTHEIGIRMALGAERGDVLKMVLGYGARLALMGVGIGIVAALGLTRFLSSLLFGVAPTDPVTFVAVSLILTAVALLACYIPARRATQVDPMVALRYE